MRLPMHQCGHLIKIKEKKKPEWLPLFLKQCFFPIKIGKNESRSTEMAFSIKKVFWKACYYRHHHGSNFRKKLSNIILMLPLGNIYGG